MDGIIATGKVSWFDPAKRFGFVKLDEHLGDAFLHIDALKAGGYYFVPRGTTVQVRLEPNQGKRRVAEVLLVDTSTARAGERPPLIRKSRAERREQQEHEVEETQRTNEPRRP